jgi:uncharacterized protein (TIGR02145 family)
MSHYIIEVNLVAASMKKILPFANLVFTFLLIILHSCKMEEEPTLTTTEITNITGTSATSGGTITDDGSNAIIARGVCWSTAVTPTLADNKTTDDNGENTFVSNIIDLDRSTTYYVRAYATNNAGTGYGNEKSFTTSAGEQTVPIIDLDGNIYDTVTIGTQTWMKENLKTTLFKNGTVIPLITDKTAWYYLTTPAYCWYNNDEFNKYTYGALYNWYAVNTGNLCPTGWHVPTDAEWAALITYLGGSRAAVGKLKEAGLVHWQSPNTGATNKTGFKALPGGCRDFDGTFYYFGYYGFWWSSTEFAVGGAWSRQMGYDGTGGYGHGNYEQDGFSVRCLMD